MERSIPPPNSLVINWQNWKDFSAEGLDISRPRHSTFESVAAIQLKAPSRPSSGMPQSAMPTASAGYTLTEADMGDWRVDSDYGSAKDSVRYASQPSSEYEGSYASPIHSPRSSQLLSSNMAYPAGQRW
ncbi:hypothetical protein Unana1_00594 [Umbelopsis nana]